MLSAGRCSAAWQRASMKISINIFRQSQI